MTAIDPLVGLDMQVIVRGFGIFFLPFGTVLCTFTVTGLVGTFRNSHRLNTMVRHSFYFCLLLGLIKKKKTFQQCEYKLQIYSSFIFKFWGLVFDVNWHIQQIFDYTITTRLIW